MTPARLRTLRAATQGLLAPIDGPPEAIVRRLLAVQAQDFRGARLALRARAPGAFAAVDVDAALTDRRSLAIAWLMRGTLHLVASEDLPWLLALIAPTQETAARRRLGQLGIAPDTAERAVAVVDAALADAGPLPRSALAERMAADGIPTEGQATPHLLWLAVRRGVAVLGPVHEGEPAFALARDWLGKPPRPLDRDAALAELARRWLAGQGPGTDADLAAWSGLPLRDARAGLHAIAAQLTEHGGGLVDLANRAATSRRTVPPRLLPAFDPFLLGWRDRSFAVPEAHAKRVHPGGGMLRAVATARAQAVGTWTARRRSGRLDVVVEPFAPLPERTARALAADARDVARFEGHATAS
jgi:hypothetical protein